MNPTPCACSFFRQHRKKVLALPMVALLAACNGPLDYDLRGQIGAFNTTNAAQTATENRPTPDALGLITYPTYQVAVAQRGDTVATVSERINLPIDEIARLNGVQPSDTLRKGEVLVLPRRAPAADPFAPGNAIPANPGGVDIATLAGSAIDQSSTSSPNPGSVTTIELKEGPKSQVRETIVQDGPEPVQHRVTRGETAYTIARLYQVPVKSLGQWNGLDATLSVREGQLLLIPVKDSTTASPATAAGATTTAPGEGSPTPTPPSATNPLPQEAVIPTPPAPPVPVKVEEPTRAPQSAMAYPVQGKIIRAYSKGKSDGIDIAATAGGPVKAAESGSVAAITKDSNGVPFLVIRHDTGLLTVYSNVDGIRVRQGERVDRGQTLAVVRKEDSGQAYVHFQIRDGLESVDPLPYLQ